MLPCHEASILSLWEKLLHFLNRDWCVFLWSLAYSLYLICKLVWPWPSPAHSSFPSISSPLKPIKHQSPFEHGGQGQRFLPFFCFAIPHSVISKFPYEQYFQYRYMLFFEFCWNVLSHMATVLGRAPGNHVSCTSLMGSIHISVVCDDVVPSWNYQLLLLLYTLYLPYLFSLLFDFFFISII